MRKPVLRGPIPIVALGFMAMALTVSVVLSCWVIRPAEAVTLCQCEIPYIANVAGYFSNCFVSNLTSDNITVKFRLSGTTEGDYNTTNASLIAGSGITVYSYNSSDYLDINRTWNIRFTSGGSYPVIGVNGMDVVQSGYLLKITGNRYAGVLQFKAVTAGTSITCTDNPADTSSVGISINCVQTNNTSSDTRRELPIDCKTVNDTLAF